MTIMARVTVTVRGVDHDEKEAAVMIGVTIMIADTPTKPITKM